MLLGVYGADVIKVEPPEGDWSRFLGTTYGSHTTLSAVYNRGKRSLCLDMKQKEAVAIAKRLAKDCDVLIEGFRPGVAARLGIGYEELARDNPGLIYLSVSAFGQSGPYSKRPGSDSVAQAFSGLVSINVGNDGTPHRVGTTISDVVTGVYAFQAIATTLFARATVGTGRWIDVNLCASTSALARPQGRRAYSGRRRAARAQRARGLLPDQRRLDDGDAGQRTPIQAAVRGDRTRRSRQRSALCRFRGSCGLRRYADLATARGVRDPADRRLAVAAACGRPDRRANPQSRRMAAQCPCRGDKGAVCQDTPGVGPVYTPRTPGIASLSEDNLRPSPDIGQDSFEVLLEAGLRARRDRRSGQGRCGASVRARQGRRGMSDRTRSLFRLGTYRRDHAGPAAGQCAEHGIDRCAAGGAGQGEGRRQRARRRHRQRAQGVLRRARSRHRPGQARDRNQEIPRAAVFRAQRHPVPHGQADHCRRSMARCGPAA